MSKNMKIAIIFALLAGALIFGAASCSIGNVEPVSEETSTDSNTSSPADAGTSGYDIRQGVQQNWPSGSSGTDCNNPNSPGYNENCF